MPDIKNKNQGPKEKEEAVSPLRQTLYANLLFWFFLMVTALISFFVCGAVWDDVTSGVVEFLFVILGGGFTLVSVLDYLYDQYASGRPAEGKK